MSNGNTITLVVTAETAAAAANLRAFVDSTGSGLNEVRNKIAGMGKDGEEAGEKIKGMAYYFRSGIDSIRFGLAGGGERAAFYAVDELTRGLVASGMAMSSLLPIFAMVGAAVGAGYLVWDEYARKQKIATEQTLELQQALEKLPETFKNIQDAANTGLMGQGAADALTQMLTGQKKYMVQMPMSQALDEGRITPGQAANIQHQEAVEEENSPQESMWQSEMEGHDTETMVNVEATLAERVKMVNDELVQRGYLLEKLDQKGKATGKYEVTPAGQALLQERELQRKMQLESLDGYDREREAAKQKHEDAMQQYKEIQEQAVTTGPDGGLTEAQRTVAAGLPKLKQEIEDAYKAALADINQKQMADAKVTVSPDSVREKDAKDFSETQKQIEDQMTAKVQASGKERETFYQEEYHARIVAAQQALYSGQITEDQYRDVVNQATTQMLESQKKLNEELKREQELRRETANTAIEGHLKSIQDNPFLTDQQKAQQSIPLYQQQMRVNDAAIGEAAHTVATSSGEKQAQAQLQIVQLLQQQYDLQGKINQLAGQNSWDYQLRGMVTHFENIKSLAQTTTEIFSGTLTTAMDSVASNLSRAVMGTEKWRQAVMGIEEAILGNLISAIIKAAEQWVMSEVMKYTLGEVLQQSAVAAAGATATEESMIWWTPAILSTIASAGTTAVDAAGLVGTAILGFAAGGRPAPGQLALVGEEGPELWVPDEAGTIIPHQQTAAMMSQGRGSAGGYSPGQRGQNINMHFYDQRPHPKDYLNSAEGEHHVVNIVNKKRMAVGIRT